MTDKMISQQYANDIMFELEKAIWDERGKGGKFRVTTVGRTFFQSHVLPSIKSTEIEDMVGAVESALRDNGIISHLSIERDGQLLRLSVTACTHRAVEDQMTAHETKPFTCIPANLIVLAIEEKLDRPAEIADIKLEDGVCKVLIVLFDRRPFLG